MRKYRFADFAAQHQQGFRNNIVALAEVPALVRRYRAYECFLTYFLYNDEIFAYMATHAREGHPSIAGYDGKVWAPFLPIDIDSADLGEALAACRIIARTLAEDWKIPREACHLYFSGAKGFHVLLDTRLFGKVVASQHLHWVFSAIRTGLIHHFPYFDRSLIDLSIKDRVRLLRLPNTVNAKSGLYKTALSFEELLSDSMEEIRRKAHEPRPLLYTDESGLVSKADVREHPLLAKMFRRIRRAVRRHTRKPFAYPLSPRLGEDPANFLCPGLLQIWESHVESGTRNNCAIRLLSEFRLNGLSEEKSRALISQWNEARGIGLSAFELGRTIHSAYSHPFPYRYSCRDPILQKFCPFQDLKKCEAWRREKAGRR